MKVYPACIYKKSCGYDLCLKEECPEYKPKKRGEPYYGEEDCSVKEGANGTD